MAPIDGWIGVDLDGCLAHYGEWKGPEVIGKPIKKMADRLRKWIKEGREVRIMTARVSSMYPDYQTNEKVIKDWLIENFGEEFGDIEITNEKDGLMVELWDDRCVQVIPNTGERADGKD